MSATCKPQSDRLRSAQNHRAVPETTAGKQEASPMRLESQICFPMGRDAAAAGKIAATFLAGYLSVGSAPIPPGRVLDGVGQGDDPFANAFANSRRLTSAHDGASPSPNGYFNRSKIRFDLGRLDRDGLQGPPDGLRALHYEYCIPDCPEAIREVGDTDPTLQIQRGSPGRAGCREDELLCLGHTHQPDYKAVLQRLADLPFIVEIREAFFE